MYIKFLNKYEIIHEKRFSEVISSDIIKLLNQSNERVIILSISFLPGSPCRPTAPRTPGKPGGPSLPSGPGKPGRPIIPGSPSNPGTPSSPGSPILP